MLYNQKHTLYNFSLVISAVAFSLDLGPVSAFRGIKSFADKCFGLSAR
jgi:hypothetical protein